MISNQENANLDWDAAGADEGQIGLETRYEAVVEHPELGRLTWSLWQGSNFGLEIKLFRAASMI
ncbi:hypothetical protein ACF1BQ_029035 [Bradyrhizobium sp. RDT10]